MSEQDREREQTLDAWWSSVIKRAFERRHSEGYIAWHDMQAATAAAVPPGHVVVPVDATVAMSRAGHAAYMAFIEDAETDWIVQIYRAMIAAAEGK